MTYKELIPTPDTGLVLSSPLPMDQNPAAVYLASLAKGSRATMAQALNLIANMLGAPDALSCNWGAVRFQHTALVRSRLIESYAPATASKMLCALRGTLKAAWNLEQMSAEDYQRARSVEGITGVTLPAGRQLQPGEIAALMQVCENDPTPAGARDAAIIAISYSCGLRREEVTALTLADCDSQAGSLKIHGKRRKERLVYLANGAARALADWLEIRGDEPGALFVPIHKGGKLSPSFGRMTNQAIYNMARKRATQAGVKRFSPHDFRRSFVSDLLDAGADIATVARMAGHGSVTVTQRYDHRSEESKRKAAGLLYVPYTGRK